MPEDRPRRTHRPNEQRKNKSGWQLIAVQHLMWLLFCLCFRAIGGSSFEQLRRSTNKSIMSNSLLATWPPLSSPRSPGRYAGSSTWSKERMNQNQEGSGRHDKCLGTDETIETNETTSSSASTTSGSPSSSSTAATRTATMRIYPYHKKGALRARRRPRSLKVNRLAYKPLKSGKVTSRFGYRKSGKRRDAFIRGLISRRNRAPISAMYFGRRRRSKPDYGNYVQIYHGNGIKCCMRIAHRCL